MRNEGLIQPVTDGGAAVLMVGDVGGTWTRLAAVDAAGRWIAREQLPTPVGDGLESTLVRFRAARAPQARCCVLAVAGPVVRGCVKMTNTPLSADGESLRAALGLASVHLLNDLEAAACALPALGPGDRVLLRGAPNELGNLALIAPGTGLGEAFLVRRDGSEVPSASEGGHSEFAPRNREQEAMLRHFRGELHRTSFEHFCSGPGLWRIHRFLLETHRSEPTAAVAAAMARALDPVPVIVGAALADAANGCAHCRRAVLIWRDILAAEAANLALKVFATGGVWFAGGMISHLLPLLRDGAFGRRFADSGPMASLLGDIPLAAATCIDLPLLGAGRYGLGALGGGPSPAGPLATSGSLALSGAPLNR